MARPRAERRAALLEVERLELVVWILCAAVVGSAFGVAYGPVLTEWLAGWLA